MTELSEGRSAGREPVPSVLEGGPSPANGRTLRRVALASLIGTTIEFYDFFLYGLAASLVFGSEFFPKVSPAAGTLASLATFGVGFLARPLGGVVFGHFGDRVGRKRVLITTLLLTGGSTFVIGLLPPYSAIGIAAPALLVLCRLLQGLGVGGEWGGAVLLAAEHAPPGRRAFYSAIPQMGNPIGLVSAIAVLLLCNGLLSVQQFHAWGWRIPFLLSAGLVVTGLVVRLYVLETPAFERARAANRIVRVPLLDVLRRHPRELVFGTLVATASPAVGLLVYVYLVSVGQQVLHLSTGRMLFMAASAGVGLLAAIWGSASLAERVGRTKLSVFGLAAMAVWALPFFLLFQTRSVPAMLLGFVVFGATVGIVNGPQAAILADLFPVPVRYTGVSFAFQLASILGGALAPLAAVALFAATGNLLVIGGWAAVLALVSLASFAFLPKR
ncbi:MAG TPA: MFS transporter [Pseudonocardia sp.]|jgi:MFS family permease|nr:MFS transporter [Pseudonocardia sp.]